jgi:predicted secreted protein
MTTTYTTSLFADTYKDDFADSANFHRVLFNSGKALQARELTQLQTIIQTEISRFGNNIFKDGAAVNPGGASINSNIMNLLN